MNWAIAVFGVMLVISIGFWFIQGHRSYLQTDSATFGVVNGQHDGPLSSHSKADEDARDNSLKKMMSDRVS